MDIHSLSDSAIERGTGIQISQSLIADYAAGRLDSSTAEAFEFMLQQNSEIAGAVADACAGILRVRDRLALNS